MGKGAATLVLGCGERHHFVIGVIIGRACTKDEFRLYMLGFTIMSATSADSFLLYCIQRQAAVAGQAVHLQLCPPMSLCSVTALVSLLQFADGIPRLDESAQNALAEQTANTIPVDEEL